MSANDHLVPDIVYRPWHVKSRAALFEFVQSLSTETHEWLLAFYVDAEFNLLAVETVAKGEVAHVTLDVGKILCRGRALAAHGFLLVHNHPSGDTTPSAADVKVTQRLRQISTDLDMPLLDHFIVAGAEMKPVGYW